MFPDEEAIRTLLLKWLKDNGLLATSSVKIGNLEVDVAAIGAKTIEKTGFNESSERFVYAFEAKIATTLKLARDCVEQAITRLLFADYVLVVVPGKAKVWVNSSKEEEIRPPQMIKRIASGTYSIKLGIISINPKGSFEVYRSPSRSGITIRSLKAELTRKIQSQLDLSNIL